MSTIPATKIWIDLDNTPHVPFFLPIIRELRSRGHIVFLTARDAYQVCELADKKNLQYVKIGRHYGKNKIMKLFGLLLRTVQLAPFYLRHRPRLVIVHGSRSLLFLCNFIRIPSTGTTSRYPVPAGELNRKLCPVIGSMVSISAFSTTGGLRRTSTSPNSSRIHRCWRNWVYVKTI